MTRRHLKWSLWSLLGIVIVLILSVLILLGTPWGTRTVVDNLVSRFGPQLAYDRSSGTFLTEVTLRGLRWEDGETKMVIEQLDLQLNVGPLFFGTVRVSSASLVRVTVYLGAATTPTGTEPFAFASPVDIVLRNLVIDDLTVGTGTTDHHIDRVRVVADLSGSNLRINELSMEAPWISSKVAGNTTLVPPFAATLDISWQYNPEESPSLAGMGKITGDYSTYDITHELTRPYSITTKGKVTWRDDLIADVMNTWEDLDIALGETRLLSPHGSLGVTGSFKNYRFDLDTTASLDPLGNTRLVASGSGNAASIELTNAQLTSGLGTGQLTGRTLINPGGVTWDTQLVLDQLDTRFFHPELTGRLNLELITHGQFEPDQKIRTDTKIERLSGQLFGQPVVGNGELQLEDEQLVISDFSLVAGENRVTIAGKLDQVLDLNLSIQAQKLETLLPRTSGGVRGEIRMIGPPTAPQLEGELDGYKLKLDDWFAETMSLQAGVDGPSTQTLGLSATQVRYQDRYLGEVTLDGTGTPAAHVLRGHGNLESGAFQFSMESSYRNQSWSGIIDSLEVRLSEEIWRLQNSAEFGISRETQTLSMLCLDSGDGKELCASLDADQQTQTLNGSVNASAIPVAPFFQTVLPGLASEGQIDGDIQITTVDQDIHGTFDVRLGNGTVMPLTDIPEVNPIPVEFEVTGTIQKNRLLLDSILNVNDGNSVNVNMSIQDIRSLDSELNTSIDLTVADGKLISRFMTTDTQIESGTVRGKLALEGKVSQPQIRGSLQIRDGVVDVPASGIKVSDIQLDVQPETLSEFKINGSAQSGEGQLQILGRASRKAQGGWLGMLTLAGTDIELIRLPDFSVSAAPDLELNWDDGHLSISGDVVIPRATIALDELPESAVEPSPDTVIHRTGHIEKERGIGYSIQTNLAIEPGVKLTGLGLTSGLSGQLQLTGSDGQPLQGVGSLTLVDGQLKAYGQPLDIERGQLTFTGPLDNPLLDLRATRTVEDTRVGIDVTGPTKKPRSTLFSEPAMSEAAALAYLITGRSLDQAQSQDANEAARAALALGLSNSVAAEIRAGLGLDELSVKGGEDGKGQVLAGKRFANNLYLQYAFGIFDRVGSLLVRYQLNDRLTFESESGQEQSLDIIYSVKRE